MSAFLTKMSALPPKADMCSATRDVRFVPIADIASIILFRQDLPLQPFGLVLVVIAKFPQGLLCRTVQR